MKLNLLFILVCVSILFVVLYSTRRTVRREEAVIEWERNGLYTVFLYTPDGVKLVWESSGKPSLSDRGVSYSFTNYKTGQPVTVSGIVVIERTGEKQ